MGRHLGLLLLINLLIGMPCYAFFSSFFSSSSVKTHVSPFDYYGKSKIGLFKWENECVISIAGRDEEGNPISLALWLPDVPNSFFIFPDMTNVSEAIDLLNQLFKNKIYRFKNTSSELMLGNKAYSLFSQDHSSGDLSVLVTRLNENPEYKLMDIASFNVELNEFHNIYSGRKIQFDLMGFVQALDAYKTYCSEK